MTDQVVTQVGSEVWASDPSATRVTQVGAEVWNYKRSSLAATQVGMEVWAWPTTTNKEIVTQVGLEVWASSINRVFHASSLWRSDITPSGSSTYVEAGSEMNWTFATVLLPDNQLMVENSVAQANLSLSFIGDTPTVDVSLQDTDGDTLGSLELVPSGVPTIWGAFLWGAAPWGGTKQNIAPFRLDWTEAIVFKQAAFVASGVSASGFRIGDIYMNFQILGYQQQSPSGVD